MKKTLIFLFAFTLVPGTLVLAQDNGGHRDHASGGGGGWGNSGSGGGFQPQPKRKAKPVQKAHKSPGGLKHAGGSFNHPANQHFNNGGVQANHSFNGGANNNAPHHFGQNAQGGNGLNNGQNHFSNQSAHFNHAANLSANFKQMGVKHLPPTMAKTKMLTADPQHSTFVQPHMGPGGEALHASVIAPKSTNAVLIQSHMTLINHNSAVMGQINIYNHQEMVPNHYYWHSWNGANYCHYYDNWGYHWYGWYWGNTCFWSRWYGNHWWWYDPGYARWCYWYDGFWWWQDPYQNVVYVYNNGEYNSAQSNGAAASAPPETGASTQVVYKSNDGTRMVKIVGNDAFLYDTGDAANNKPFYLATGVKDVQFSNGDNGQPLQISLTFNDGTSQTFDSDGNPVNNGSNGNPGGDGANAPTNGGGPQ